MKRLVRWCWIWICVFCRWFSRKNDYYWPGRRAWFKTAALVATCNARGCDRLRYGDGRILPFHWHRWTNTRTNPYGVATEQHCRCGAWRYHLCADVCGFEPRWNFGRHPYSANAHALAEERSI